MLFESRVVNDHTMGLEALFLDEIFKRRCTECSHTMSFLKLRSIVAGGIAVLIPLLVLHPDRKSVYAILRPQPAWKWMFWGTFFGSYLSLVCWLAGFKYSQAGIVALLNQTSTVLIVMLASFFLNEPMTRLKVLAVAMACVGAAIVIS